MTSSPRSRSRRSNLAPTPEEYAAFIGQIELEAVWLGEAHVFNAFGPGLDNEPVGMYTEEGGEDARGPGPGRPVATDVSTDVAVESSAGWSPYQDGFHAWYQYGLQINRSDGAPIEIEVVFGLRFRSERPMTSPIFELFKEVNLPVNTWPFLREFVHSMTGRMGWTPITLPALKRGTTAARHPPADQPAPAKRKRTTASPRNATD